MTENMTKQLFLIGGNMINQNKPRGEACPQGHRVTDRAPYAPVPQASPPQRAQPKAK